MHKSSHVIGLCSLAATFTLVGVALGATYAPEKTHVRLVTTNIPDRHFTPGWINPFVKQSTLVSTVCVPGYSRSIRPPISYTKYLKKAQIKYYRLGGTTASYEEDHFIPLSLGGSPYDTRNLWPEPKSVSRITDTKELQLWYSLCRRDITLRQARAAIIRWKLAHG